MLPDLTRRKKGTRVRRDEEAIHATETDLVLGEWLAHLISDEAETPEVAA